MKLFWLTINHKKQNYLYIRNVKLALVNGYSRTTKDHANWFFSLCNSLNSNNFSASIVNVTQNLYGVEQMNICLQTNNILAIGVGW